MPMTIENFRMTAALDYAGKGWHVFPCHTPIVVQGESATCSCGNAECTSIGKHPRTPSGLKDASDDEATIRSWWDRWPGANIGIVTGEPSGIIVLDVDAGHEGFESLGELCDSYGQLPETLEVETGGGGLHMLFIHPGEKIKNSASRVGRGLDVRGDGGYIVAAPSLHKSGNRYRWKSDTDRNPCEAPEWLIGLMREPEPPKPSTNHHRQDNDAGQHWLGKALAKTVTGHRNETGLWLAIQLRDSGMSEGEAQGVMRDYASRVPQGSEPYREREALQSLKSAYSHPRRDPAKNLNAPISRSTRSNVKARPTPANGAAAELKERIDGLTSGRISNIPWPWPFTTSSTFSLLPGAVTCLIGDTGVGKTFCVLQCLQFWLELGADTSVFFIEKDRVFHTHRLLAQLEGDGRFVDYEWLPTPEAKPIIDAAMERHTDLINSIGRHIFSAPLERVTLDSLLGWVRQEASAGRRIIVIDPITAVSAGDARWTKDEDFIMEAQAIMTAHGSSLVIVTHAKKGNRPAAPTIHDIAGGAAYGRFADSAIWMQKIQKPRRVVYKTIFGSTTGNITTFFNIQKARNSRGQYNEIAFLFDHRLKFAEQGIVQKDVKGEEEEQQP